MGRGQECDRGRQKIVNEREQEKREQVRERRNEESKTGEKNRRKKKKQRQREGMLELDPGGGEGGVICS